VIRAVSRTLKSAKSRFFFVQRHFGTRPVRPLPSFSVDFEGYYYYYPRATIARGRATARVHSLQARMHDLKHLPAPLAAFLRVRHALLRPARGRHFDWAWAGGGRPSQKSTKSVNPSQSKTERAPQLTLKTDRFLRVTYVLQTSYYYYYYYNRHKKPRTRTPLSDSSDSERRTTGFTRKVACRSARKWAVSPVNSVAGLATSSRRASVQTRDRQTPS
jgi:hypothetical protein